MHFPFVVVLGAFAACSSSSNGGGGGVDGGGGGGVDGGGGTGGSASLTGSVDHTTFSVASKIAVERANTWGTCSETAPDGGLKCSEVTSGRVVVVVLTNRADLTCSAVQSAARSRTGVEFANLDELDLSVANVNGAVTAGTYDIAGPGTDIKSTGAVANFETTTSKCSIALTQPATKGTVTLSHIGSTSVSGSFAVTFGSKGAMSGSFDVPLCAIPDGGDSDWASTGDAGAPSCKP